VFRLALGTMHARGEGVAGGGLNFVEFLVLAALINTNTHRQHQVRRGTMRLAPHAGSAPLRLALPIISPLAPTLYAR
jgi:hypothetical protein